MAVRKLIDDWDGNGMAIRIIGSIGEMRSVAEDARSAGRTIALVPTMGALHDGHLSLVRMARERAGLVVVSIYVNPTQFAPGEDFEKYPRNIGRDVELLADAGADAVFTPSDEMMYPSGYATYVTVEGLTDGLCGRSRPDHFKGVATIVTKLFTIVRPHIAVFGQKDAQQLAVIRRMTGDLNLGVEIVGAQIVREPDGLAMSSRNAYLTAEERSQAIVLSRSLVAARNMVSEGEMDAGSILGRVREVLTEAPLGAIEYVELVDPDTMKPVEEITGTVLLAMAVRFGSTRLIDNTLLRS